MDNRLDEVLSVEREGEAAIGVGVEDALRHLGEAARGGAGELERDDGLIGERVLRGERARQVVTGENDGVLGVEARPHGVERAADALDDAEYGGLADEALCALHVLHARELYEQPLLAKALDVRLGDAEPVDALTDDAHEAVHLVVGWGLIAATGIEDEVAAAREVEAELHAKDFVGAALEARSADAEVDIGRGE